MSELDRLAFVASRDGADSALEFAKRTYKIYRQSVLQTGRNNRKFHFASTPNYRPKFLSACVELRRYIAERA